MLLSGFQEKLRWKELRSLRLLNVMVAVIITVLGFVFEFAYHDGYILATGLLLSLLFSANYFLSVYSTRIQKHFTNITYVSILLLHIWAVFVAFLRHFEIGFLLPVALSTFIFSLIFDRFYKSFLFIFAVTTLILLLMLYSGDWHTDYTIALAALYSGAILADVILKRRNEYQQEIQRREDQYITLVENMNDGLIFLDLQLKITWVNERFTEITGHTPEEVTGKHVLNIYPAGESSKAALRFFQELSSGKSVRMDSEMLRQDGTSVSVQMAGAPLKVTSGFRVVYADITALKETQDRLKRREEAYRTFIGQSAVGIWRGEFNLPVLADLPAEEQAQKILDNGSVAECNDAMAGMYGLSTASAMAGRNIRTLYSFEGEGSDKEARDLMRQFVENGYRLANVESRHKDREGTRYFLSSLVGIVENDRLVRTWGVQADITERKKTERELVQTNQELDTFFYKASHDLKGPLASIMGIVQLARLDASHNEWPDYLDMIESSTRKLDNTLLDLIELARTRKGVSKLNPVRLGILVDEVLYSLKHMSGYNEVALANEVDKGFELVSDSLLLQSILQNLVHNAINYRSQEKASIRIAAGWNGKEAVITVDDNGKGIPEDIRNKVFDMFYRGHPDSAGSGLGLFIVKNAVDKLKGDISFESEVGKGTKFTVRLPDLSHEN